MKPSAMIKLLCLSVSLLLLSVLALPCLAVMEMIPLKNGQRLQADVIKTDAKGILVRKSYGDVLVPWDQVSPVYKPKSSGAPVPGVTAAKPGSAPAQPSLATPNQQPASAPTVAAKPKPAKPTPHISRFTVVLILLLLLFWVNVFCVWVVSQNQDLGAVVLQQWNLTALIFGVPALLLFLTVQNGFEAFWGIFRGRAFGGAPAGLPDVMLLTWDSQPVKPGPGGKKAYLGLIEVQKIMKQAVEIGASDVHFDTTPSHVEMGFRVDGVLRNSEKLTKDTGHRMMTAIKNASGIDLGKIHEALDGACHLVVRERKYDLRIARAWAVNGETMVIRILKSGGAGDSLAAMGMTGPMVSTLKGLIRETAGIIVLAGPTGSGKTSTVYCLLRMLAGTGRNILTIEDPVEYQLPNATQISLNTRMGNTFAGSLKASMRHDPDVILVGEIRDSETMDTAFQAALTGHLVFTTIHATSLLATFGRLTEFGISAYMVNTGLKAIVCQRLVRLLCPTCRESYIPEPAELAVWGLQQADLTGGCFYRAKGCPLCTQTGYHGRTGVYRVMPMTNEVRSMFKENVHVGDLQTVVERDALGQVNEMAKALLLNGATAPEELQATLDMFDYGKRLWNTEAAAPPVAAAPPATGVPPAAPPPAAPGGPS